jgi:argininosuccinate lyase
MSKKKRNIKSEQKMWGGRFKEAAHPLMEKLGMSVQFDQKLAVYDIQGSIAHARMLAVCGIISKNHASQLEQGLKKIRERILDDEFKWDEKLEDVHTNIESALRKEIGEAADALHTARSRNDQVALDLRLYLRDELTQIQDLIRRFQKSLLSLAEANQDVIIPGFTHLQRAQPVLLAHHLLAYVEMLSRDQERLLSALERVNVLPLGSCAMAGTTFKTDRKFLARELRFPKISENSMDAVSDRDFAIETLSVLALLGVHISRLSEELILWSSFEFNWIELPDSFTTGSSAMPQKKNPDACELARGKSGRLIGNLMQLMVLVKGLPLTYNRDLQEDKESVFDSIETVKLVLQVMAEMIPGIHVKQENLQEVEDFSSSMDLAEYLVRKGVPFRQSHSIVGKIVLYCLDHHKTLQNLTLSEAKSFSENFESDFKNILGREASVKSKRSLGSTSPVEVLKSLKAWKKRLS